MNANLQFRKRCYWIFIFSNDWSRLITQSFQLSSGVPLRTARIAIEACRALSLRAQRFSESERHYSRNHGALRANQATHFCLNLNSAVLRRGPRGNCSIGVIWLDLLLVMTMEGIKGCGGGGLTHWPTWERSNGDKTPARVSKDQPCCHRTRGS